MLYQDPQDIYHSAYKHTLEWTYTIFRHFTLLAFLNTTTHTHTHTLSKVHSKLFKWDSIWFSRPPMHWTEPWAPLRNIYIYTNHPHPLAFLDISLCYMTLGPVAGKWQLFCSSSLLLRDSQNTSSGVWKSRSGAHSENCSQKHTHRHTNAEWRNKRAGLWPGHVTNGPLEGVQKNISQSKLMPFKCTQLPLAGQFSELKEYLMTVCLALS